MATMVIASRTSWLIARPRPEVCATRGIRADWVDSTTETTIGDSDSMIGRLSAERIVRKAWRLWKTSAVGDGSDYRGAMEARPLPTELAIPHSDGPLLARLPTLDDLPSIVDACQDPEISRWTTVPSPYGEAEARGYVESSLTRWGSREGLEMVITAAHEHPLAQVSILGAVLAGVDWARAEAVVGYWIAGPARRRGVASAAVFALSRFLLDLGFHRLEASVMVGNPGSGPTLRKVGYRLEGVRRNVHARTCGIGDRLDLETYSLLPGELIEP